MIFAGLYRYLQRSIPFVFSPPIHFRFWLCFPFGNISGVRARARFVSFLVVVCSRVFPSRGRLVRIPFAKTGDASSSPIRSLRFFPLREHGEGEENVERGGIDFSLDPRYIILSSRLSIGDRAARIYDFRIDRNCRLLAKKSLSYGTNGLSLLQACITHYRTYYTGDETIKFRPIGRKHGRCSNYRHYRSVEASRVRVVSAESA